MAGDRSPGRAPLLVGLRAAGRGLLALPRAPRVAALLAWIGLIAWLGGRSSSVGRGSWGWSYVYNLGHAFLYGLLALWLVLAASGRGWPALTRGRALAALAAVLALGACDELRQATVPGRDSSVLDVATDVAGAAGVLATIAYLGRRDAREGGLALRLGLAALASLAAALVATALPAWVDV